MGSHGLFVLGVRAYSNQGSGSDATRDALRIPRTRCASTRPFRMPQAHNHNVPPATPEKVCDFPSTLSSIGTVFLVLVYTLMQGATNGPQKFRVMHKQNVLLRGFSKKGRIASASHWPRITETRCLLAGWAIEPMFQRSPYGFLSDGICQETCHHMSLLGDICDPPKYYPCRGDHD